MFFASCQSGSPVVDACTCRRGVFVALASHEETWRPAGVARVISAVRLISFERHIKQVHGCSHCSETAVPLQAFIPEGFRGGTAR